MVRLVEGQIVEDDEGGGATGGRLCRAIRFQSTINFVGFRVPLYWSLVATVFAWLKFGVPGLVFVAAVAGEAPERETLCYLSCFSCGRVSLQDVCVCCRRLPAGLELWGTR